MMVYSPAPPLWLTQVNQMRDALRSIWTQYLVATPDSRLTLDQCWLLIQMFNGPQSSAELTTSLGLFVDQPQALVDEAEKIEIIESTAEGYRPTAAALAEFQILLPTAQVFNERWRGELVDTGIEPQQLEMLLAMLQGRP